MPITEYVQPITWVSLLTSPATLHTRHSERKCRKYFRRKKSLAVVPLHDRNLELIYSIREQEDMFRMFRQVGPLENSPLGFDLKVEENSAGTELELRFALPRWFIVATTLLYLALILSAFFLMDWWPAGLTLAVLALISLAGLHIAATDRRELERFLVDRFGEKEGEDNWFDEEN